MISTKGNKGNEETESMSGTRLSRRARFFKRKLLLGILLIGLCAASAILIAMREPTYDGRLSSWVSHLPVTLVTLSGGTGAPMVGEARRFRLYKHDFGVSDQT